jgi:hypothetical protein
MIGNLRTKKFYNIDPQKLLNVDDSDEEATRPTTSERASQTATHPVDKVSVVSKNNDVESNLIINCRLCFSDNYYLSLVLTRIRS